ncbi:MAG: RloB domain-containing protein [Faecalibacterium sp.]
MKNRKQIKKYYFSVEGETEQWYLKHLQQLINSAEESAYTVSFDCPIYKNPTKRVKSLVVTGKTEIHHLSDYESDDPNHVKEFTDTMDNLKKAQTLGKQISYKFGYSNLTFDLWILLHKAAAYGSISHRKNLERLRPTLIAILAQAIPYSLNIIKQQKPAPQAKLLWYRLF